MQNNQFHPHSSISSSLEYVFKEDWLSYSLAGLNPILEGFRPQRILEIGSYQGRSTCHFIETVMKYHDSMQIVCIDSWQGGQEHQTDKYNFNESERMFQYNMQVAKQRFPNVDIVVSKGYSHDKMIELLAQGYANYFDMVYVDGSHEAPDVLFDAVLAHKLTRVGGVIAFDDYLWSSLPDTQQDHYLLVKPAVDAYVNTYQRKLRVIQKLPIYQLYVQKLAD